MVSKVLIICEGGDDVGLLNRYIKEYLEYAKTTFQIEPMCSKSFLLDAGHSSYSKIKAQVETRQYSKVLFVFDSDFAQNDAQSGGYINSEIKIRSLIQQLGFKGIADYYICCDPITKNGNLEHLLLSSVEQDKRSCIENFIDCIQGMNAESNKKIIFAAYQTIFKEAPYNFDHPNFDELKQKIAWLFS